MVLRWRFCEASLSSSLPGAERFCALDWEDWEWVDEGEVEEGGWGLRAGVWFAELWGEVPAVVKLEKRSLGRVSRGSPGSLEQGELTLA